MQSAISCKSLIGNITSHCQAHPNQLLACNDTRLAQYHLVLKNVQEAQKKAEEAQKKAEKAKISELKKQYSLKFPQVTGSVIIDRYKSQKFFDFQKLLIYFFWSIICINISIIHV